MNSRQEPIKAHLTTNSTGAALRCSPVSTFLSDKRLWSSEPGYGIKTFAPRGHQWFKKHVLILTLSIIDDEDGDDDPETSEDMPTLQPWLICHPARDPSLS